MAFELPALPYAHSALADRGMGQETLELHHDKHHQTYVTNLNNLIKDSELATASLEATASRFSLCVALGFFVHAHGACGCSFVVTQLCLSRQAEEVVCIRGVR